MDDDWSFLFSSFTEMNVVQMLKSQINITQLYVNTHPCRRLKKICLASIRETCQWLKFPLNGLRAQSRVSPVVGLLTLASVTQGNETLFSNWQKESWQTFEETSGYVRPERVNKWPNCMTDIWWWWWKLSGVSHEMVAISENHKVSVFRARHSTKEHQ